MKFKVLKVSGNSMHPTIKSGAFVLVFYSKLLLSPTNKISPTKKNVTKIPFLGQTLNAVTQLNVGDIVAVNHEQYGLIIKRIVKIDYRLSEFKSSEQHQKYVNSKLKFIHSCFKKLKKNKFNQEVRLRLSGDNELESITENEIGWIDLNLKVGKVVYIIRH